MHPTGTFTSMTRSHSQQVGGGFERSLKECEGCSVAKEVGKPIGRTTSTREDKVFNRLLVDVYGEKSLRRLEESGTCY